ncbi:MAG TPA: alpha/beta fold hydrolase, partial [Verrucomicrobiae bacterium]|nr:alpha/beta fold hydrolase [Verrucomicrobiae bacterium]
MQPGIERTAGYHEAADHPFFYWYHAAPEAEPRDLVAVVCGPIGSEYTRSHRSLRHLADRLAQGGIPALRFDYHGTGNSPGTDLDPGRVDAWLANIRAACEHAKRLSGRARVCLIGLRLGGTLAAVASREIDPALLVLWNAPAKGRPYLRELQAVAALAARSANSDGTLEAAGGVLTAETLEHLRALDLTAAPPRAGRVLLVSRDDMAADASLEAPLNAAGIEFDTMALPGWNGMMADHQFTVVPDEALTRIVEWAQNGCQTPAPVRAAEMAISESATVSDTSLPVVERVCRFGADAHLFGILSRTSDDADKPAVLIFNGGAVHHVGPNRVYVTLARHLASMGFACLRFDLEGIGDSVLRKPGRENHPYPEHAIADARAAMDFLRERYGYRRFIAMGLCSGAHTAFHTALALEDDSIEELVLINPFAFYWKEGMSLDV